jgi:hypothetical protein
MCVVVVIEREKTMQQACHMINFLGVEAGLQNNRFLARGWEE